MALLYAGVPAFVLVLWVAHAWLSWTRPGRIDPVGRLLLIGLPVATVVTFVVFGSVDEPRLGPMEALPPGEHGDLRLRLLVVAAELGVMSFAVFALELVLTWVRAWRRPRSVTR